MSEATLGGLYLDASQRNAQRIADLQAEIDALRAQLANAEALIKDLEWRNDIRSSYIAERDATITNLRAQLAKRDE